MQNVKHKIWSKKLFVLSKNNNKRGCETQNIKCKIESLSKNDNIQAKHNYKD